MIFEGFQTHSHEQTIVYGNPALGNFANEFDYLASFAISDREDSLRTSTQPVDERRTQRTGFNSQRYGFLDFYNRIHIQFKSIDLSDSGEGSTVLFYLFNAWVGVTQTLDTITETGTEGIDLEDDDVPNVFASLVQKNFTLTLVNPPENIAKEFEFDFTVQQLTLTLTGLRLALFPYPPVGPFTETIRWATDIETSFSGVEQRMSLREGPRTAFAFAVSLENAEDVKLQGLLFDWMPKRFGLPLWHELRAVGDLAPGLTVIPVSTANASFAIGKQAFFTDGDSFEIQQIVDLDANSITLAGPLVNDYSDAQVMPLVSAYAVPNAGRQESYGLADTKMQFVTDTARNAAYSGSTYRSAPLLKDPNLYPGSASTSVQRDVTVVDTGTGLYKQTSQVDRSKFFRRKGWLCRTQAQLWEVRQLLHTLDGSRQRFFLPTFKPDLVATEAISGTQLTVRACDFTKYTKSRSPRADVRIRLTNGTEVLRRVIGSAVDGANEVLTLDSSAGTILLANISRIELMECSRIADDTAVLVHQDGQTVVTVNTVTIAE